MNISFIVTINSDDVLAAPQDAERILDLLEGEFDVVEVHPWHRESLATTAPLSPPQQQAGPLSLPTNPGLTP